MLLIDEDVGNTPHGPGELRLLTSGRLDSPLLLALVLVGDGRLPELLRRLELLALG